MNMRSQFFSTAVLLCALSSASFSLQAEQSTRNLAQEEANRELVVNFYNSFFNQHDIDASKVMVDNYRQHNPHVPDGKAPMVGYFTEHFKQHPQAQAKIIRSATEGDLVYLHVHSSTGPEDRGVAIVDIFRVEDGRIVEHWDVIQAIPEQSANDNSMF